MSVIEVHGKEVLDVFDNGEAFLFDRKQPFSDFQIGSKFLIEENELTVQSIDHGRNRLLIKDYCKSQLKNLLAKAKRLRILGKNKINQDLR